MTRIYVGKRGGLLIADEHDPHAVTVRFAGSNVNRVALDPANPDRVYVGLYSGEELFGRPEPTTADGLRGVWRSDDGGEHWHDVSAGLSHPATTSLAVRGEAGGFGTLYAGSEPSALSISHDGGSTWRPAGELTALPSAVTWAFPPRPYTHHVRWIELDPTEPEHLYLAIEAGAVIQGGDDGMTWQDRVLDGPFDAHTLLTHPQAPGRLYAAAGDGFAKPGTGYAESRDAGQSWTLFADGLDHHYLFGLAVDSGDPDTVLVSAAASAMQAHDPTQAESYVYRRVAGRPWELVMEGLPPARGTTIPISTAHPSETGAFYLASNQGVFRSHDAGTTWEPAPISWQPPGGAQNAHSLALAA
jgi:photosystem II stability/assembly factor-like uncharacterized protein